MSHINTAMKEQKYTEFVTFRSAEASMRWVRKQARKAKTDTSGWLRDQITRAMQADDEGKQILQAIEIRAAKRKEAAKSALQKKNS